MTKSAVSFTFTEKIPNGKLHFLWRVSCRVYYQSEIIKGISNIAFELVWEIRQGGKLLEINYISVLPFSYIQRLVLTTFFLVLKLLTH